MDYKPTSNQSYHIQALKSLSRLRDSLVKNRSQILVRLTVVLDIIFPEYKPVPYIMNAATDSRYFNRVCENCLRFVPFKIDDQQLDSIHGIDENVDIDTLAPAVDFYRYVIKEA